MKKKQSNEARKGGTPTREILYSEAAKYAPRAIEIVSEIMEKGDNDNARLGAAKIILSKAIPDLKALELAGVDGGPIQVNILGKYASPGGWALPTPAGSSSRSNEVQSIGLAQESTQDINSNREDKT